MKPCDMFSYRMPFNHFGVFQSCGSADGSFAVLTGAGPVTAGKPVRLLDEVVVTPGRQAKQCIK